jgi:hypothetical protein
MQRVTLVVSGQEVRGPVTPHLTVTIYATGVKLWLDVLEQAKKQLQPYYDWATEQAR